MNISTISYWFYEAFESMKKNIKNVLISVSTMIATMIIIAVGYIILMNSNYIIEQKQEASSKIMAFLEIDVSDDEVSIIQTRLNAMKDSGLVEALYISQDEAIKQAGETNEMLVSGYTEEQLKEIYQPYFKITFETLEAEEEIISTLKILEGVGNAENDIVVSESAQRSIKEATSMKIIAITAMVLIIELSIFLMMNSTKLMLYARRKEISIMKYVGAKDTFVKMPFAIEGIIIAVIAAIIVMIIVSLCYEPIVGVLGQRASYKYLTLSELMSSLNWILIAIGVVIGAFGSTISMNKYLDV